MSWGLSSVFQWSSESIATSSTLLHVLGWGVPAIFTMIGVSKHEVSLLQARKLNRLLDSRRCFYRNLRSLQFRLLPLDNDTPPARFLLNLRNTLIRNRPLRAAKSKRHDEDRREFKQKAPSFRPQNDDLLARNSHPEFHPADFEVLRSRSSEFFGKEILRRQLR